MDVDQFVQWLRSRSKGDLDWMLRALTDTHDTADGTVGWIRATHDVEVALRRSGRVRDACQAAHRATGAAMAACEATGLCASDRSGATRRARAAGDAALGLVAGDGSPGAETLLRPFFGATVLSPV